MGTYGSINAGNLPLKSGLNASLSEMVSGDFDFGAGFRRALGREWKMKVRRVAFLWLGRDRFLGIEVFFASGKCSCGGGGRKTSDL
jgi:hypothetical protein